MVEIKQTNPNAFAELNLKLEQLQGFETKVGWFDSAVYDDTGTPVAYVAAIQELGSGPIPPRPFMRPAEKENQQKWMDTAGLAANKVLDGTYTGRQAMDLIGATAEADISKAIHAVNSPPLSPITLGARKYRQQGKEVTAATIGEIARKLKEGKLDISGVSTKPLNDTGKMIATLMHLTESTT